MKSGALFIEVQLNVQKEFEFEFFLVRCNVVISVVIGVHVLLLVPLVQFYLTSQFSLLVVL